MSLYADDVKLWREITRDADACVLQADLNIVISWSKGWLILINAARCVCIHVGYTKANRDSIMKVPAPLVQFYKDFAVTVSHDLNTMAHCCEVAAKGFGTLWALRRTFTKLDTTIVYTTLMRSKLGNYVSAASPCLKGDSDILENVQRAATRAILELRTLLYKDRLEKLDLFTLSYRRLRGDLISMFKIPINAFGPNLSSFSSH
ncbi:unnamed protein product [Schistosoma rodhaini]|nr:unnamed protein product [Schistosoma rodhaini]